MTCTPFRYTATYIGNVVLAYSLHFTVTSFSQVVGLVTSTTATRTFSSSMLVRRSSTWPRTSEPDELLPLLAKLTPASGPPREDLMLSSPSSSPYWKSSLHSGLYSVPGLSPCATLLTAEDEKHSLCRLSLTIFHPAATSALSFPERSFRLGRSYAYERLAWFQNLLMSCQSRTERRVRSFSPAMIFLGTRMSFTKSYLSSARCSTRIDCRQWHWSGAVSNNSTECETKPQ